MNHFKKNFTVGNRQATIEYGEIGRQANATRNCETWKTPLSCRRSPPIANTNRKRLSSAVDGGLSRKILRGGAHSGQFFSP